MEESKESKAPKDIVQNVLREYVSMNKCALVHTAFEEYISNMADTDFISVGEIRKKFQEFEQEADKKLRVFITILNSEETHHGT
jgi:RIO-like serine/threonine protein kinase